MIRHIPNFITCINAFCGCIGIVYAFQHNWNVVLLLVFIALVADFLDGFAARLLKVSSEIGGELDSLADAITFGVLPGVVMYQQMSLLACKGQCTGLLSNEIYPFIAFLIPVLSIVRLAKFNVDTEQSLNFKGLPTPACAAFFISLPLFLEGLDMDVNPRVFFVVVVLMSLTLVSDIKLIALKFTDYSLKNNWEKYVLVIIGVLSLVYFGKTMFVFVTPGYILVSIVYYYILNNKVTD